MEAVVLVDSNIYIGLLRRKIDPIGHLGDWIGNGDLATCGMVRIEVERGLKAAPLRDRLAAFFNVTVNAPTGNTVWERAAEVAWRLDRQGRVLPAQDILIAACAVSIGALVLTDDQHFLAIPGAEVLNPARELPGW